MKLDKIKHTLQGFSYVDVNLNEVKKWGGLGICDGCGKGPYSNMKLVWVLHDTYCSECFNEWLERCKSYFKEDIEYDLELQKDNDIKWYQVHGVI